MLATALLAVVAAAALNALLVVKAADHLGREDRVTGIIGAVPTAA